MAALTELSIEIITGRWNLVRSKLENSIIAFPKTNLNSFVEQNNTLSDSYDSILKMQNVNWLTHKVLIMGTITMSIKQVMDEEGLTHLTIDSKSVSGLLSSTENRFLNNEIRNANYPLFGKITSRIRWAALTDLPFP